MRLRLIGLVMLLTAGGVAAAGPTHAGTASSLLISGAELTALGLTQEETVELDPASQGCPEWADAIDSGLTTTKSNAYQAWSNPETGGVVNNAAFVFKKTKQAKQFANAYRSASTAQACFENVFALPSTSTVSVSVETKATQPKVRGADRAHGLDAVVTYSRGEQVFSRNGSLVVAQKGPAALQYFVVEESPQFDTLAKRVHSNFLAAVRRA